MNCQAFENVVNDVAHERIMDADVRELALSHRGKCEPCARRLEHERILTFQLRTLAREMSSLSAPARVEEHLVAAFRDRTFLQHRSSSMTWGTKVLAGAAAVLLIIFGIIGLRFRNGPRVQGQVSRIEPVKIAPLPLDATAVVSNSYEVSPSKKTSLRMSASKRNLTRSATHYSNYDRRPIQATNAATGASANPQETEVATEFMSLGYMSPINLQDGAQVVRVELPRSAMVSLGLPVNMDRYGERVKADVLLGADGLAHAIRFVQ
jgi:hypothetical protein